MPNYAKANILGHLCRDWEMRRTASNTPVASNTIAVTHKYKDRETKLFLKVTAWSKSAETLNEYTRKGSALFLECRLQTEEWQDREGNKRQEVVGVVENFQFIDSNSNRSDSDSRGSRQRAPVDAPHEPVDDSSIPF